MSKSKNPMQMLCAFAQRNKNYPARVRKFFGGLYATLFITHSASAKDMEKIVYYAYKNGYVLGAAEYGGDPKRVEDEIPDLGFETNKKK